MISVGKYQEGEIDQGAWAVDPPQGFEAELLSSYSFTLRSENDIIAILTAKKLWEGVLTVALLPGTALPDHPVSVVKEVLRSLEAVTSFHDIRKVYTLMDSANPKFIRWIKFLGFSPEYVMKEAGPDGQDMIGYVKSIRGI